jgi:hypothetical protein
MQYTIFQGFLSILNILLVEVSTLTEEFLVVMYNTRCMNMFIPMIISGDEGVGTNYLFRNSISSTEKR